MKLVRNETGLKAFTLFTGIIFLNMSFILAEFCSLELTDPQMIENVCNLILNGGVEEEREGHGGAHDAPSKLFSPPTDQLLLRHASLFLLATKTGCDARENYLSANHAQKFSPPPERHSNHFLLS